MLAAAVGLAALSSGGGGGGIGGGGSRSSSFACACSAASAEFLASCAAIAAGGCTYPGFDGVGAEEAEILELASLGADCEALPLFGARLLTNVSAGASSCRNSNFGFGKRSREGSRGSRGGSAC